MSIERTNFTDLVEASLSGRSKNSDGYLIAPAVLARAGVFSYTAKELGLEDRPPQSRVRVFRSPETLALASQGFESQTITLDHKWTTALNWRSNAVGDVRDVEMSGDQMAGTLIVRDAKAIEAIEHGKTQLSNGYSARLINRAGKFQGEDYEFEQTEFVPNHVAIVDRARCGSSCRVGDSLPFPDNSQEPAMSVQRSYDGLTISLENEQGGQVVDRMVRDLAESRKALDDERKKVSTFRVADKDLTADELTAVIAGKDGEIKQLKDSQLTPVQIHALVVERSNAMAAARELVPDIKIGDSDDAHRIHVLTLETLAPKDETVKAQLDAAFGAIKLADVKPEALTPTFASIAEGLKRAKVKRTTDTSRAQVGALAHAAGADHATVGDDPRKKYIDSLGTAYQGPKQHKEGVN